MEDPNKKGFVKTQSLFLRMTIRPKTFQYQKRRN